MGSSRRQISGPAAAAPRPRGPLLPVECWGLDLECRFVATLRGFSYGPSEDRLYSWVSASTLTPLRGWLAGPRPTLAWAGGLDSVKEREGGWVFRASLTLLELLEPGKVQRSSEGPWGSPRSGGEGRPDLWSSPLRSRARRPPAAAPALAAAQAGIRPAAGFFGFSRGHWQPGCTPSG